jgi:hypothetical protein
MARANNKFKSMIQTARGQGGDGGEADAESKRRSTRGKSSNPDYEATTIYLPKTLKRQAVKILVDDRSHDLSDVMSELLEAWVDKRLEG